MLVQDLGNYKVGLKITYPAISKWTAEMNDLTGYILGTHSGLHVKSRKKTFVDLGKGMRWIPKCRYVFLHNWLILLFRKLYHGESGQCQEWKEAAIAMLFRLFFPCLSSSPILVLYENGSAENICFLYSNIPDYSFLQSNLDFKEPFKGFIALYIYIYILYTHTQPHAFS